MGQASKTAQAAFLIVGWCSTVAHADAVPTIDFDRGSHAHLVTLDPAPIFIGPGQTGANSDPPIVHERGPLTDEILAVSNGNNQFAIDIYRQLASGAPDGKNLLVSPLSISAALTMTYAGASGRTAEQMADVLHFTLPDEELHAAFGALLNDLGTEREGYDLSIANRLFGQEGYAFKQRFLDTTANDYGAPLKELDFKHYPDPAREHINDWVEDKTRDRIKDLLPAGSIDAATRLVLANAIHFDGAWKYKFDERDTHDAPFYLANGQQSQASLMFQRSKFRHGKFDGFQALEMPYAGDDLSMVVLLPDEVDGLASLETSLSTKLLTSNLDGMRERDVVVYLPKFTFEDSFNLSDPLQALGIRDAFSASVADLSDIADEELEQEELYISDAFHKTFIDVSEEGTEAAAATAVIIGATSVCYCPPPPTPVFRADHPFLFALRDKHTGSLMFIGRVAETGSIASSFVGPTVPEPSALMLFLLGTAVHSSCRHGGCRGAARFGRL